MTPLDEPNDISDQSPVRVLVVGGSYGGLSAALNLLDLCQGKIARFSADQTSPEAVTSKTPRSIPVRITIVDERDGYYHLIGSPLALALEEFARKAWVKFKDIPALQTPGLSYVHGSLTAVDCEKRAATISDYGTGKKYEEKYDYLVASSGLRRVWPVVPQSPKREEYLTEVGNHIQDVKSAKEGVVVIGGGAVGVEMAAELKLVLPTQKVTMVHSRERILSSEPLPDSFKDESLRILRESGVNVILGHRVVDTSPVDTDDGSPLMKLTLSDGSQILAGSVIMAISRSTTSASYLPEAALDNDGLVKISPSLHFPSNIPNAKFHFAIGDMTAWSGIKRCGAAMAMGFNAARNIHQQLLEKLTGKEPVFVEFPEVPPMIGLAIGKKAVSYSPQEGTESGEHVMKMFFGDDLGFTICWNYLKLSESAEVVNIDV